MSRRSWNGLTWVGTVAAGTVLASTAAFSPDAQAGAPVAPVAPVAPAREVGLVSTNVATTTFTGLGANSSFPVPPDFRPALASHSTATPINLTGVLRDGSSSPAPVPGAPFVLSGTAGVRFIEADGVLSDTFTGVATAEGALSDGVNAFVRVIFTTPGMNAITLRSGATAVATTGDFRTLDPVDAWRIGLDEARRSWGSTLTFAGRVTDLFGNGVPAYNVRLDLGDSPARPVASTLVATDRDGIFRATFVAGSMLGATVTVKATLTTAAGGRIPMISDPVLAAEAFGASGFTPDPHGRHADTATVTAAEYAVTLASTAQLRGGGKAVVSGAFMPGAGVDIYARTLGVGGYTRIGSVATDQQGDYSASYPIYRNTSFQARSAGLSSEVATTLVHSTVSLTATSSSHNRATLSANGSPSAKGTLTFYRSVAGKDPILKTMTSNASGNGVATVKLPKGTRSVYVIFKAPGTDAGTSKTVRIAVK